LQAWHSCRAAGGAGNSDAAARPQASGDQPIQIESDRLDVNEQEAKAIFAGNVSVVQARR
jgi:lipopolysaccharide export system protein LptA